jgi:hypothetical protein
MRSPSGLCGSRVSSCSRPIPTRSPPTTLRANPALVVHLESGDRVVIVEGTAMRLDDRPLLARFGMAYEAKYDWPLSREDLDPANPDAAFYAVRPRAALSWGSETEIGETITRWNFDRSA